MDRTQPTTAADLVQQLDETALADLIWRLGEEPASRRIARFIVAERAVAPILTTGRLAAVVEAGPGRGKLVTLVRSGEDFRLRELFDASLPALPGLAATPRFEF